AGARAAWHSGGSRNRPRLARRLVRDRGRRRPPGAGVLPAAGRQVAGDGGPLFFQCRGGKGGATLAGTLIAFSPALLVVALAAWFAAMLLFGYVGLATTVAAVAAAIGATQLTPASGALIAYFLAVAALVAFAHRGNFARIRAGTEPREKRLWLLKPRGSER